MKLFVWDNVLCSYWCGLVVVHAESVEDAKRVIEKELPEHVREELSLEDAQVYETECAFYVYGGG